MRKVVWATEPYEFEIKQCDVDHAIPGDSDRCVKANAIGRQLGPMVEQVVVHRCVVKIYTPGQVTLFRSEPRIRRATLEFDKTGEFSLPLGRYTLLPYRPEQGSKGGGRDKKPGTHGKRTTGHRILRTSEFEKAEKDHAENGFRK